MESVDFCNQTKLMKCYSTSTTTHTIFFTHLFTTIFTNFYFPISVIYSTINVSSVPSRFAFCIQKNGFSISTFSFVTIIKNRKLPICLYFFCCTTGYRIKFDSTVCYCYRFLRRIRILFAQIFASNISSFSVIRNSAPTIATNCSSCNALAFFQ